MARLEEFYHKGNELTTRTDVKEAEKIVEKLKMGTGDQVKELRQRQYLQPENPLLWNGEFDDD